MAALWVLLSHVQILTGMPFWPIVSWGQLAVDLFIMLSEFLMAWHYVLRRAAEPFESRSTWWHFWVKRFFRIAPLYYFLLFWALVLGPDIGAYRNIVGGVWPHTLTDESRYIDRSLDNLAAHLTFVFGMIPFYSFRTALPDWSIGLEMQFYAVFPLLMLACARWGFARVGVFVAALSVLAMRLWPEFFSGFAMPSFLPMKIHMFFVGMWLAVAKLSSSRSYQLRLLLVISVVTIVAAAAERSHEAYGRILVVMGFAVLLGLVPVVQKILDPVAAAFKGALASRALRVMGDVSYGVYLLHLLILIPVAGVLASQPMYLQMPMLARFGLCAVIVLFVVYPVSWLLYKYIEQPGIQLGKSVLGHRRAANAAAN